MHSAFTLNTVENVCPILQTDLDAKSMSLQHTTQNNKNPKATDNLNGKQHWQGDLWHDDF